MVKEFFNAAARIAKAAAIMYFQPVTSVAALLKKQSGGTKNG